jgi:hypothetical protein
MIVLTIHRAKTHQTTTTERNLLVNYMIERKLINLVIERKLVKLVIERKLVKLVIERKLVKLLNGNSYWCRQPLRGELSEDPTFLVLPLQGSSTPIQV